jgi:UDP-N-acetylmuramoylalanine--D-glutamate ligase
LCFGDEGDRLRDALSGAIECDRFDSLETAMARAAEVAMPGDTILLSLACASFDEFSGFAERGDAFVAWVHRNVGVVS